MRTGGVRPWVQGLSAILFNGNLKGFFSGSIHTGALKGVCVPVLNCYSCPGALGACPIGSLQSSLASIGGKISFYVVGMLVLFAVTLGRFFCGWLCPFGWVQELLHKIRTPKLKIPKKMDRRLRWLKYGVLAVLVVGLPLLVRNGANMSEPYFCKWLCPAGTLEGGIPLALVNEGVRSALGGQFLWKAGILAVVLALSVALYRPFCKYLCPLGAFYGLFSKLSLYRCQADALACIHCGACEKACPMGVNPVHQPNDPECIRCGVCQRACPTGAMHCGLARGNMRRNAKKGETVR